MQERFCIENLPLFSNSQPAEFAVKEAKNVSTMGRFEELWTVMAIGRSAICLAYDLAKNGKERANNIIAFIVKQHKKLLVKYTEWLKIQQKRKR